MIYVLDMKFLKLIVSNCVLKKIMLYLANQLWILDYLGKTILQSFGISFNFLHLDAEA